MSRDPPSRSPASPASPSPRLPPALPSPPLPSPGSIRLREYRLPLSAPLSTAHGSIDERPVFLLWIGDPTAGRPDGRGERRSDRTAGSDALDGRGAGDTGNRTDRPLAGVGEAAPLAGWTESVTDCRTALTDAADALRAGESPATVLAGVPPDRPAARHAVELAVLDRRTRAAGRPLWTTLGADESTSRSGGIDDSAAGDATGPDDRAGSEDSVDTADGVTSGETARPTGSGGDRARPDEVAVNATVGDLDAPAAADRARRAVESGFRTVKLKVGAGSLDRDRRRVRAVREAVGPDVALRADANGAWTEREARRIAPDLAPDVEYLEQPLPADRLGALGSLRSVVPVGVDESVVAAGVDAVVDADAADVAVLKPMALGGPLATAAVARRVRRAGIDPVVTTTVDAAVARTAAVHVAAVCTNRACGLATADRLATDLRPDPATVADGAVRAPAGPGLADPATCRGWWRDDPEGST